MKILYDHQVFTWQNFGGISRYYYELLSRFRGSAELSLVHSNNEYIRADPLLREQVGPRQEPRRYSKLEKLFIPKKVRQRAVSEYINIAKTAERLRSGDFDLLHPTYYDPYFLEQLGDRPFVLTVFDMIHELFPEFFFATDPNGAHKRKLVSKAAHIIAISQTTKNDLMQIYGVEESRISVTYLGSSLNAGGEAAALALPEKYFLMVGSRGTYKNCYFAARALNRMVKAEDLSLVFAGGGQFSKEEIAYFAELGLAGRVHYFPAADADLRTLYSKALGFIFPSQYEGFGIPTLEAFSCGCPVLSSNTVALREVAGDAAVYFEPKNLQSIESAAGRLIREPGLRERLSALGSERLKHFSWDRCADQTMAVYTKVLNG